MNLEWVTSEGGPLLLLPCELAAQWLGVSGTGSSDGGVPEEPSDYDRACTIDDWLGTVSVGDGTGLVINGSPLTTAFMPRGAGGIIVRVSRLEEEDLNEVATYLKDIPESDWNPTGIIVKCSSAGFLLFDSARDPRSLNDSDPNLWSLVLLKQGAYSIDSIDLYNPDENTELVLHRLRHIDDG